MPASLKVRRCVYGCFGAFAGFVYGWIIAITWLFATGNHMMFEELYEQKRVFLGVTIWSIVLVCSLGMGTWAIYSVNRQALLQKKQKKNAEE